MYWCPVYAEQRQKTVEAYKIIVTGLVQGVGFRPYIYRLAEELGLKGYVKNLGGSEVEIHLEGDKQDVKRFLELLEKKKPPPAFIEETKIIKVTPQGFKEFKILSSGTVRKKPSIIPPDFAICDDCMREVLNPRDRRYNFPFNSCAWCGPRYSMMYKPPYDRENTSMMFFPLCGSCLQEYRDPKNTRRFHAQGISCPACGPRLWLEDSRGEIIASDNPLREAARLVDEGYILAIKGLGGFHVAALASDDEVVLKLRRRKRRREKPFAMMVLDLETACRIVEVDEDSAKLLSSPQRPIVILPEKDYSPVSRLVAPGLNMQGIMLPYTALHYLLLADTKDKFLIMTSGNLTGEAMCTGNMEARIKLKGIVDYYLMHNRRIVNRVDDSVLRVTDKGYVFLRRSRGYAPKWIQLPFQLDGHVIALGAELQNTGAVAFEDKAVLTQFIGDLEDLETLKDLEKYIRFLAESYNIGFKESIVVVDKHPRYLNRLLARKLEEEYGCRIVEVQHHHAHIASVMVEAGLEPDESIVGIAIDGTGYGEDGNSWGGEVLYASYGSFRRIGHLQYLPLPGGDRAVRYPVRMLIAVLSTFLCDEEIFSLIEKRNLVKGLPYGFEEAELALRQCKADGVLTSSLGRVLDATSSLLGVCLERTYEGEPAMKLEASAKNGKLIEGIEADIRSVNGAFIVDTSTLFEGLIENLDKPVEDLAYTVQYVLGSMLAEIAAKTNPGNPVIAVSGGAAVNSIILKSIREKASEHGFKVIVNRRVPPGDGGLSLGQIAVGYFKNKV